MHFSGRQRYLVCVVIARGNYPAQDVLQLRVIADQFQKRFAMGTRFADAQDIFCSRVEPDDQQRLIEQNDTRTQAVEDLSGMVVERAAARTLRSAVTGWTVLGVFFYRPITFCCT